VLGCSLSAALRVISPHVGEGGGRDTDAYKRIQAIQDDLFAVVKEMLLFLFHKGESDEKVGSPLTIPSTIHQLTPSALRVQVWSAALNCTLFFITNQGRLDKAR
jgi:hypothetical protein